MPNTDLIEYETVRLNGLCNLTEGFNRLMPN